MFGIFDAIKAFFEFIISVVSFALELIKDLLDVVGLLGDTLLKAPLWLSLFPSVIVSAFVGVLAIVVLYKVIGRT